MTENSRRIMLRAATWLLGFVILGGMSVPLSEHFFIAELLASIQPLYVMALGAAAALSLILRHRPLLIAAFALAVMLATQLIALHRYNATEADQVKRPALTLLSFNVRRGSPAQDAVRVATESSADLALFFETTAKWKAGFDPLGGDWPFVSEAIREDYHGVSVRARLPMTVLEMYEFGASGIPVPIVEVKTVDGPLVVIAVHSFTPLTRESMSWRNDMLSGIASKARHYAQSYPVVVAGDLNITPFSRTFSKMLDLTGLKFAPHGWANLAGTWPTWLPTAQIPIDHALLSDRVGLLKSWQENTTHSDHKPLLWQLTLTAP